ncbi:hypothetical protein [Streptomyces sp. NPDC127084]|uniref:hypothetical protein n=1 Tax=Streptomyces sp. NPDC127084 TaxID=3347133 RepID=UPI00364B112C
MEKNFKNRAALVAAVVSVTFVVGASSSFAEPQPSPMIEDPFEGTTASSGSESTSARGLLAALKSLPSIWSMRTAQSPEFRHPRQESMDHINDVLDEARNNHEIGSELTVGETVASSIGAIKLVADEHGAAEIDKVFKDPSLDQYYKKPWHDRSSQEKIAEAELSYWKKQHESEPNAGTEAAIRVSVEQRADIQMSIGSLSVFNRLYRGSGEQ